MEQPILPLPAHSVADPNTLQIFLKIPACFLQPKDSRLILLHAPQDHNFVFDLSWRNSFSLRHAFCYQFSSVFICLFSYLLIVGEVKLGEEGESEKAVEFSRLSEFHHDGRVEVIAWSPESSLLTYPKVRRGGSNQP